MDTDSLARGVLTRLQGGKTEIEVMPSDNLLENITRLQARAMVILTKAETANDWRISLSAIREAKNLVELLARLMGELDDRPQINVLISPEWAEVRAVMLQALAPYPEARQALAAALSQMQYAEQ